MIGETVLITLYRRSVLGPNPATELARFLHEANFTHTAPLLGTWPGRGFICPEAGSSEVGWLERTIIGAGGGGASGAACA